MLRLLSDADVPGAVVRALKKRHPELDVVRAHSVGLRIAADAEILEFAAREGRQVFTRDRNTMTAHAYRRVIQALPMPGLFVIPEDMPLGQAVTELEIIALANDS